NRVGYLKELERMGLKVKIQGKNSAKIFGPAKFIPTKIDSLDLRAGITLLIAATMTEGKTIIREAENIDRGYENIEDKLKSLGAKIKRTDD
ncbi:MAG: UDP-N-acetylglucosamine 1-carboxyvinyltransferase, partial [Candidatus Berkelbacteria bacterium]|nr:UDP-N-acetylglucosamine 1-carboxyvinyltransferase [Candidatus Berkelbacteria bacterium]